MKNRTTRYKEGCELRVEFLRGVFADGEFRAVAIGRGTSGWFEQHGQEEGLKLRAVGGLALELASLVLPAGQCSRLNEAVLPPSNEGKINEKRRTLTGCPFVLLVLEVKFRGQMNRGSISSRISPSVGWGQSFSKSRRSFRSLARGDY